MSNFFGFIKSTLKFVKIVLVFLMLMLLLYWVKNLANLNWTWLGFIAPVLDFFLYLGKNISNGVFDLFGALFEYRYFWALAILGIVYYITHILYLGTEKLEDAFDEGHKVVKRLQENKLNNDLKQAQVNEQLQIKKYRIFISTSAKKTYSHLENDINLEEQNKILNKFLMEKLGIAPSLYKNGFLYEFHDFNTIDDVIDVFFKVLHSKAPLNYTICVQAINSDEVSLKTQLDSLIDLKFENKISMMSDTAFRYGFNNTHRYGVSQIGLFQKNNDTIEVHEFVVI